MVLAYPVAGAQGKDFIGQFAPHPASTDFASRLCEIPMPLGRRLLPDSRAIRPRYHGNLELPVENIWTNQLRGDADRYLSCLVLAVTGAVTAGRLFHAARPSKGKTENRS